MRYEKVPNLEASPHEVSMQPMEKIEDAEKIAYYTPGGSRGNRTKKLPTRLVHSI